MNKLTLGAFALSAIFAASSYAAPINYTYDGSMGGGAVSTSGVVMDTQATLFPGQEAQGPGGEVAIPGTGNLTITGLTFSMTFDAIDYQNWTAVDDLLYTNVSRSMSGTVDGSGNLVITADSHTGTMTCSLGLLVACNGALLLGPDGLRDVTGTFFLQGDGSYVLTQVSEGGGGDTHETWRVASPVPVPAAAWLFGSALLGLVGIGRKRA